MITAAESLNRSCRIGHLRVERSAGGEMEGKGFWVGIEGAIVMSLQKKIGKSKIDRAQTNLKMIKKCLFERLDEDDSILLETASRLHGVEEVVSLLEDVPRHEDDRCVVVVVIRCRRHQLNNESINEI